MLLYGQRIGAAVRSDRAARRRHAGRRLPDARAAGGLRLRPRPAAVLGDHGHERRHRALGDGLARDLPRGEDLCARVRRLLRLRGADPLRRPGDRRRAAGADRAVQRQRARRAVADDHVHRAAADRGPHRRADGLLAGAADQPAAGDLRAADGRAAVRLRWARSSRCRSPPWCARASSTSASTSCSSPGAPRAPRRSGSPVRHPPSPATRRVPGVRHARAARGRLLRGLRDGARRRRRGRSAASAAPP